MAGLDNLLQCPACMGNLQFQIENLECQACDYSSFLIDEIPWVFKDPESTKRTWTNRLSAHMFQLSEKAIMAEREAQDRARMKLSRERLQAMALSWRAQIDHLQSLLNPIGANAAAGAFPEQLVNSVLPEKQQAQTYQDNIFRDWAWESDENVAHKEFVASLHTPSGSDKVAVLGAGGSRLAYDLHKQWQPELMLAIEFNPLLLLAAKRIIRGDLVPLCEYPMSPRSKDCLAIEHTLQCKDPMASDSFQFLFADASAPPLKEKSFDVVITPWFLDILPQDAETVVQQINRILKPGGQWLYFGSYYFNSVNQALSYSKEELLHLGGRNGFQVGQQEEREVPYLQSPSSCQKRTEWVLGFAAEKVKDVKPQKDQVFRPDWIDDTSLPIPPRDQFTTLKLVNKLHFEVLSSVNGQISINDLSQLVSQKYKLPQGEALEAVQSFFIKLQEKSLF